MVLVKMLFKVLKRKAYFYKPLYTSTDTEYLKIPMNVSLQLCKDALVSDNCHLQSFTSL